MNEMFRGNLQCETDGSGLQVPASALITRSILEVLTCLHSNKTPAIILLGNLSGFDRGGKILKKRKLRRVLNLSFVSQWSVLEQSVPGAV